jgi:preprotein translocase subunit SecB
MNKELSENTFPSVAINGHYIKELHFDNIKAPVSFTPQEKAPKIEIAINFNYYNVQENTYEVTLLIKATAQSMDVEDLALFDLKLAYAGLFSLNNIDTEEQKELILMVHCPSVLFPYARRVVSDITRDSGFQPLMLEHLDFASLHQQRKAQKESSASESAIAH